MKTRRVLGLMRQNLKLFLATLWVSAIIYGVATGKIDLDTVIDKVSTEGVITILLGS